MILVIALLAGLLPLVPGLILAMRRRRRSPIERNENGRRQTARLVENTSTDLVTTFRGPRPDPNGACAGKRDPKGPAPFNMPSWRKSLTDDEVSAAIAYLVSR